MSSETQARRRKDKRKKKGRGEAPAGLGDDPWPETLHPTSHDDDEFYVEPDSVSDDGTCDEDIKEHSEGGSGFLTVLVFLVLLAGVGVLLGLIYVQTQGIKHVDTPMPEARSEPVVQTIVEYVQEQPAAAPADDSGAAQPAAPQEVKSGASSASEPDPAPPSPRGADETVTVTVEEREVHHVDVLQKPVVEVQEVVQPVVEEQLVVEQHVTPVVDVDVELETVVKVVEQPVVELNTVLHTVVEVVPVVETVIEVVPVVEPAGDEEEVAAETTRQGAEVVTTEGGDKEEIAAETAQRGAEVVTTVAGDEEEVAAETAQQGAETVTTEGGNEEANRAAAAQPEEVQHVVEEHIVYVEAPAEQQAAHVDAPAEAGIQLEGSEPLLPEEYVRPGAAAPAPAPAADDQRFQGAEPQLEGSEPSLVVLPPAPADPGVVVEERSVRVRQVIRQMTDAEGNVREEIVSEEVLEVVDEEPAGEQASEPKAEAAAPAEATATPVEGVVEAPPTAGDVSAPPPAGDVSAPPPAVDAGPPPEVPDAVVEVEEEEVAIPVVEEPVVQPKPAAARAGDNAGSSGVPVVDNAQQKPTAKPGGDKPAERADEDDKAKEKEPVKEQQPKEPVKEKTSEKPKQEEKRTKEPVKEKPVEKPVSAGKPAEKPAAKPTEKPKKKETPTEKPIRKETPPPAEEKKRKPAEKPTQKERPTEKPTQKERPTEKPVKKDAPTDKPAKKEAPTEKPAKPETPPPKPAGKEEAKEKRRQEAKPAEKPADAPSKRSEASKQASEKRSEPKPAKEEKPKVDTQKEVSQAKKEAPPVDESEHKQTDKSKKDAASKKPTEGPPKKPSAEKKEPDTKKPSARSDSAKSATDKHAKETNKDKAAPPAAEPKTPEPASGREAPPPADDPYDQADITGADDWEIRDELDAADALLQTDAAGALNAFGAILSRRPRSPRALWGRGRAINAQAQQERSNNLLEKAIAAYRAVLDLDLESPLPPALYRRVAEMCVQQMRFRGMIDQAARIQQRLIQKFPDDYMLRNHLATVFMAYNQNAAAEEVLTEVLRLWPDNGYAKVHLGFLRNLQGKHSEACRLLQQGLESDEPGVHDARFYHKLGDSYLRVGEEEKSRQTYEEGAKRGLFLSPVQRSLYNVDRLVGRPYWTKEQTGSAELISDLEANWETIRDEMRSLLSSDRPEDGFQPEQENLSRSGDWKQFTLFRRGRKNQYACVKTPKTCALVEKHPAAAGCRRGQVKFSMMSPGTRVWPHVGPTNCRLRCHLGLDVPAGAGIRVAGENRTWEEGKVLVIDDSFEHEVWNDGDRARYILIVDIWHPELSEEERRALPAI